MKTASLIAAVVVSAHPSAVSGQPSRWTVFSSLGAGGHVQGCGVSGSVTCSEQRELGYEFATGAGARVLSFLELGPTVRVWQRRSTGVVRTQLNISASATLSDPAGGVFLRMGLGLGYLRKTFDSADPPESWAGLGIDTGVGWRIRLASRWSLVPTFGYATAPFREPYTANLWYGELGVVLGG